MEITERQIGRIDAACIALLHVVKDNADARVWVNIIREQLEDAETDSIMPTEQDLAAADKEVPQHQLLQETLPLPGIPEAVIPPPVIDQQLIDDVKAYGQQLLQDSTSSNPSGRILIQLILKHFSMEQQQLARILSVPRSSLSHYINHFTRQRTIEAGLAHFFEI